MPSSSYTQCIPPVWSYQKMETVQRRQLCGSLARLRQLLTVDRIDTTWRGLSSRYMATMTVMHDGLLGSVSMVFTIHGISSIPVPWSLCQLRLAPNRPCMSIKYINREFTCCSLAYETWNLHTGMITMSWCTSKNYPACMCRSFTPSCDMLNM